LTFGHTSFFFFFFLSLSYFIVCGCAESLFLLAPPPGLTYVLSGLSTLEFAILRGSPETVAALLKYFPVQTTIAAAIFALRVEHSQSTKELQDACLQIGSALVSSSLNRL
jgi:hypothetical protein